MRLKGKTVLISGAGRNNGKAIAETFAREGAELVLVTRQLEAELNQVAKACESSGARVLPLLGDVSKHEHVNRIVKQGWGHFGKIDVLVNVVGVRPHKPVWEYDYDEWKQIFDINLHSTFFFAKALAPEMMKRKSGNLIALGGVNALTPGHHAAPIASSKHGLHGLIKALARDLGPYGIRANLLNLGHIVNKRLHPEWYPDVGGETNTPEKLARTPLGRTGTPQEVANVALFLASDESSYITGDRIVCCGGRYM